jgi:hypothetical protein
MHTTLRTVLATVILISIAGTAGLATSPPASITIALAAQNGSGENGTATITQLPDGVGVVVALKGAPDIAQPSHIHVGFCGHDTAVAHGLSNTVAGNGTTTVPGVTLASLLKGEFSINVHKSSAEMGTYVACGNIALKETAI